MGSRTREALFDLLRGWFEGSTVVDLFAGVGTLGLEAASRGATQVIAVESDRLIARLLRENIDTLKCGDRVRVIEGDVLSEGLRAALPRPVDVIFCDPPFAMILPPRRAASDSGRSESISLDDDESLEPDRRDGEEAFDSFEGRRSKHRRRRRRPSSEPDGPASIEAIEEVDQRFERQRLRLQAMLDSLRGLFAERGFLALRLPIERAGSEGAIQGFEGPEIHGYGDQQWIHLYAPKRSV